MNWWSYWNSGNQNLAEFLRDISDCKVNQRLFFFFSLNILKVSHCLVGNIQAAENSKESI